MERRRKAKEEEELREKAEQKAMEEEEAYQREVESYWAALWAEEERFRLEEERRQVEMELYLGQVVEYALGKFYPDDARFICLTICFGFVDRILK